MGFLLNLTALPWEESLPYLQYIREHGILQFIHTYMRMKDRKNDVLLWGDEVEYHLVRLNQETRKASIVLKAIEVISALEKGEKVFSPLCQRVTWII